MTAAAKLQVLVHLNFELVHTKARPITFKFLLLASIFQHSVQLVNDTIQP